MPPEDKPLVFVYGTLKRGFGNHGVMLDAGGEFICEGSTATAFPLVVRGLPFLLFRPGEGHQVEGELFRIGSARGWDRLDRLEGHPDFYRRRLIAVDGRDGELYEAWAYFVTGEDGSFAGLPPLCAYGRGSGLRIPGATGCPDRPPQPPVRPPARSA